MEPFYLFLCIVPFALIVILLLTFFIFTCHRKRHAEYEHDAMLHAYVRQQQARMFERYDRYYDQTATKTHKLNSSSFDHSSISGSYDVNPSSSRSSMHTSSCISTIFQNPPPTFVKVMPVFDSNMKSNGPNSNSRHHIGTAVPKSYTERCISNSRRHLNSLTYHTKF